MPKASAVRETRSSSPWLRALKGGVGPSRRMAPAASGGPRPVASAASASPSARETASTWRELAPRLLSSAISPARRSASIVPTSTR